MYRRRNRKKRYFAILLILFVLILIYTTGIFDITINYFSKSNRYDSIIETISKKYSVEPSLIKAIIWRESNFNPKAVGGKVLK